MHHWNLATLDVRPREPQILASTDEGRAIALQLRAGENLQEHEVHERAWLVVAGGEVEVSTSGGERVRGGTGLLFEFAPQERHTVHALADTRLLLLLTPWPGDGHPGAMTLEQKGTARRDAGERTNR